MSRSVKEWVGKTDDAPVPPRVKLRILERQWGECGQCHRPLGPGDRKTCDHILALINGGSNRESNLQILGEDCCGKAKTKSDMALKKIAYRKRLKHAGLRESKYPAMPGTKRSGWKRRLDGTWERR